MEKRGGLAVRTVEPGIGNRRSRSGRYRGSRRAVAWAVEHHIASTRAVFEDLFEELFESGTLPRMSKISLRFMLTAACQSIFTLAAEVKLMYGVSTDHESQIEAHIDAVTKLLLRDELTQA